MNSTIVFIHGMFQNPKSWANWIAHFEGLGYRCIAPAWPLHGGEPAALRANPPAGLGDLNLAEVIRSLEPVIAGAEKPILIGHSVGGLLVQHFVNQGMAELGVPISSVAPNAFLSFDWSFLKNSTLIMNPLKGNEPFYMDVETFQAAFCNTLTLEQAKAPFEQTATHDSRNVLRTCLGSDGKVDLDAPHVPLLFVTGEEDQIIPDSLVETNAKAYSDAAGIVDFKVFPKRSHFICGEPGWEEVAMYVLDWVAKHSPATV